MKLALHIPLLVLPLTLCGQDNATNTPGHMVEIRGQVLDAENGDTLVFSKLKLFASGVVISESVADFDGGYSIRFCSNKAKTDSLLLQVEELGYLMKRVPVKVETNLLFTIHLEEDSAFQITEETKKEYLNSFNQDQSLGCGTAQYECDYKANPLFRHCDGRVESFRRLVELNEHMGEWERL